MAASKKGGKHMGFSKLENALAHKPGISNPAAVAASIGRKKYGNEKMAKMAEQGRAMKAIKGARKGK